MGGLSVNIKELTDFPEDLGIFGIEMSLMWQDELALDRKTKPITFSTFKIQDEDPEDLVVEINEIYNVNSKIIISFENIQYFCIFLLNSYFLTTYNTFFLFFFFYLLINLFIFCFRSSS